MTLPSPLSSRLFGGLLLPGLLMAGLLMAGCSESEVDARVKKEYLEAVEATKDWTDAKFEQFRTSAQERQQELRSELAALEDRIAEAGAEVSDEAKAARDALKARIADLKDRMDAAAAASAEERAAVSKKIGEALDSAGAALTKAKDAFTGGGDDEKK